MLNRFIVKVSFAWSFVCFVSLLTGLTGVAKASGPAVVATSTRSFATGFNGYNNKVVVDPGGNVFTVDSSNGRLWEIPAGSNAPVQIFLQNSASAVAATVPVTAVRITSPGSGYTTAPAVTFSAPPIPCAVAVCTQAAGTAYISSAGTVTLVQVSAGAGYTPTVTIAAPTTAGGTTAAGTATNKPIVGLAAVHGLTVDQYGDVIVSSASNGNLYFLPNQGYPKQYGVLCTTCNAAGTGPLDLTGIYGYSTLDGYYGVTSDVAIDNAGNLYTAMSNCNGTGACGVSKNSIFLLKGITNTTTSTTLSNANLSSSNIYIGALPGGKAALQIALDGRGHLFYADGVKVYSVNTADATPTPTPIGTFLSASGGAGTPSGVSVDPAGNLYVIDNVAKLLYEIPNEGGTLNPADQFVVTSVSNGYYSAAFDASGTIYVADGNNKLINTITLNALNAGSTAVGTTSAVATMNFRFNAPTTPASISVVQGASASTEFTSTAAGTCIAGNAYVAGNNCTVTVTMAPASTGLRQGAIVLGSGGPTPLSTALLYGTGTGAALTVDPGTQTGLTAKSAWVTPSAVAYDAAGNVYVADSGSNAVQVISASGTAIATIGKGLSKPGGVAVDGAGNVYIADTGNSKIVKVPNEAGTLNDGDQITVLASTAATPSLTGPRGIALDPVGGLYVADTGNARVLHYTPVNGLTAVVGSGLQTPVGVTTDSAGNVYVADQGLGQIVQINANSGLQASPLKGLTSPSGIAFDASGGAYVAGGGAVTRYVNVGGVLSLASGLSLSSNLKTPTGIVVNGAGNVAVADAGAPGAFTLSRTNGTIDFGPINITLSSSAQAWTVTSMGTANVLLGTPGYTVSGSTANYSVTNGGSGGCTDGLSLTVGATCGFAGTLSPVVTSGTLTETVTILSNAVNAPSISERLTGTATNLSLTTTTLALTSSAAPVYGQAVTVVGTVSGSQASVVPTGTIKFYKDGVSVASVTLSATAPYKASYTFAGLDLAGGTHVINASYSGDVNDAASNAAAPVIVTINKQPSTVALTITTTAALASTQVMQTAGSTYYFNVAVSPQTNGIPQGVVNLVAAGTTSPILATATISSVATAQLVYAVPANAAVGTYQYQIFYVGDGNFVGNSTAPSALQIVTTNYSVALPATTYTVATGQSVVVPMTITGLGGYKNSVTVGAQDFVNNVPVPACMGLPKNAVCIFSPGIIALTNGAYPATNPSGVMNLTIQTGAPPSEPYPIFTSGLLWPGAMVGLFAMAFARRRKVGLLRERLLVAAFALGLGCITLGLGGCGTSLAEAYKTPVGTSAVTVTFSGQPIGTQSNIVSTITFQLIVQ